VNGPRFHIVATVSVAVVATLAAVVGIQTIYGWVS
jgi:hypothetical protein